MGQHLGVNTTQAMSNRFFFLIKPPLCDAWLVEGVPLLAAVEPAQIREPSRSLSTLSTNPPLRSQQSKWVYSPLNSKA